ncbi:MAG: MgtC/SapB family protein [Candidatus Omnitrophota bacterium]|nr:MgtC/SapB family protein [Candidatus Omnitrophota bacterium]MDZ4243139.1 MgtC/SapB family protein [Candidatus Omnitrophota bacterium]
MNEKFIEITVKILLTILLCGLIGWEREIRNKVAGLRTHILVGVGSALIVLTSFYISDIYKTTIPVVDPTRMVAGIVTGIGFLCAGTIIRAGDQVIGLTTAATLWIVSGIGMAVGAGDYLTAGIVTVIVFFVLIGVRSVEGKIRNNSSQGGGHGA